MSQEKQCENCRKRFSNSLRFCPRCGTYWKQGKQNQRWTGAILSTEQIRGNRFSENAQSNGSDQQMTSLPERYIICERCKKEIPVDGDTLPDFCCYCNTMVDGLAEIKIRNQDPAGSGKQYPAKDDNEQVDIVSEQGCKTKRDPLYRKNTSSIIDNTSISFIWLRPCASMRLSKPDIDGAILLGTKGNYEIDFFSNPEFNGLEERQAAITHETSGWYLYVEGINLRLNNEPLNIGDSRHLKNNDRINLGNCTLQVEILTTE